MTDDNKKILLVEDNIVNQKMATLLLQQIGLNVEVVDNGRKALQSVESEVYAVILMDCQMPELDGFETTRAIRKLEALRGTYTPIIAVTALSMVGDKERCISAGMDDYISKPIDRQMLKIKLNYWLQKEVVLRNQELSRKFAQPVLVDSTIEPPVDLAELQDYYGKELGDVLSTYVRSTDRLMQEIHQSITDGDGEKLAYLAHELKGSSASVGAKGAAKICLLLERSAGLKDFREASEGFTALSLAFTRIKDYINQQNSTSHEEVTLPGRE